MLFQGKDGELRIIEYGASASTHYIEVLFCEMDMSAPTARPRTEETLVMNRGLFDSDAHYIQSDEQPRYAPMSLSFSCRLADTVNSRALMEWLSGATEISRIVGGTTRIYSWDGKTTIDGNTLPAFTDSSKQSYSVECLWNGTLDLGLKLSEVYFPPGQATFSESADGLRLNANGMIYGDVTRITAFSTLGATGPLAWY